MNCSRLQGLNKNKKLINRSDFIDAFIKQIDAELKKIFAGTKSIKYKKLSLKEPYISWQKALSEGMSYTAPLYLIYKPLKGKGSEKRAHVCNLPLLTARKTFVIEGRERISLKILKPTDITKKTKRHLSSAEKSRDLRSYEVKEFNFYEYLKKYLISIIDNANKKGELSQYIENPEYFIGGLNSYLKIFNSSTGIKMFPFLDSTNPLSEVEHTRKLSFMRGTKTREGRDIHPTHYGRLCVVETPESEKIGMRLHLAHKANIDPKTFRILTPLKNLKTKRTKEVAPDTDDFIADNLTELKGKVLARGGEDGEFVDASKIKYTDAYIDQLFGYAALQVPFIQHNDPARALMGAKNLKQAVPLKNPEIPIICTGYEGDVAELSGRLIRSEKSGRVKKVTDDLIIIEAGNGERIQDMVKGVPSVMSKSAFFQVPVVKEGQIVEAGQIIAEGSGIKDGSLAVGANFLVAYMPYFGYNMDDGIVVSQSVCEKLTSIHIEEHEIKKEPGDIPQWIAPEGLKLQRSVEKEGLRRIRITPIAILKRTKNRKIEEITEFAKKDMLDGIIRKVFIEPERIRVWLRRERQLEVGDKLMGRHGNKGIVAKILPINKMPYFEIVKDSKKERIFVDIILNPHSVISRMNIGQIFETHLGWVAKEHPDKSINLQAKIMGEPFSKVDLDKLSKWLEQSGLDRNGKIKLNLPVGGDTVNPVVVGYQYIVKLNHLASGKLSARGEKGPLSFVTEMPLSGKKRGGGQRIGEMEVWALIAHGTREIVMEMLGQKGNAHLLDTGAISISESLKVLTYYLRGLGICLDFIDSQDNVIEPEDFDKEKVSKLRKYRISWADDSKIMSWGRYMYVPEKSQFEKLKDYLERKGEETEIRNGARNILNLNEFEPEYKDEMGYINLIERVNLCERAVKVLPVIPIRCRPYLNSKINKLYKKIFFVNKKLEELVKNGKEDVEDYSKHKKSLQTYISKLENKISGYLKGKRGVIRKTILGKRVNCSARAVIIPNPDIEIDKAEIPKKIMSELKLKEGDIVLLNRQPTLHIHNIQAFGVLKSRYNAIAINPLVCNGFNADFDGDTMAAYKTEKQIPDSMKVSEQIVLSANGKLNLNLSQDIVAGIYYVSGSEEGRRELEEIIKDKDIYDAEDKRMVDKRFLDSIVYKYFLKKNDHIATLRLAERIAKYGLEWATLSGLTFSIFDLKNLSLPDNEKRVLGYENKSIGSAIKDKLEENPANPISIIFLSGARGNMAQIRQMVGIKGIVDRIGGKKTAVSVKSSYIEGLSPTEYYLACYGARNSLGDKKLLTPQCGYLTRRLVFSASDMLISEMDCNTIGGIELEIEKAFGRALSEDIVIDDEVFLAKNSIVDETAKDKLRDKGIRVVKVRSPLTCGSSKGICRKCYGWDLSRMVEPQKGFAAGIMAAEVIGERATQDAMRTYHIGTATGTVTLFDKVKAIFDNAIDPDEKKNGREVRVSDRIKSIDDIVNLALTLYDYYEGKVDIKHYEVIFRSLMAGHEFKGTKGAIENGSIMHKASFERTLEVLKESADQGKIYPINSTFEMLFL